MYSINEILERYNFTLSDEIINFELDNAISVGMKNNYNAKTIELLHSCIDHTKLTSIDSEQSITKFLDILKNNIRKYQIKEVAAVCVFPKYIKLCKDLLKDTNIKTACVAGGFPFVQSFPEIRYKECEIAKDNNCDEIDIVIPVGEIISNNTKYVREDLKNIKKACGEKTLKIILETGELRTIETIFAASIIAIESGADFIKTSTGKTPINATPDAVYTMAYAIKEYYSKTGKKIGIKISGGISSSTMAISYLSIIKHILGEEWLNNKLLRIGTSSLTEKLQKEYVLLKEKTK